MTPLKCPLVPLAVLVWLAGAAPSLAARPGPPKTQVVHVVVALCDAENQGVVAPANGRLCRGDDPENNLYWGALYGTKTHLLKHGFRKVAHLGDPPPGILRRLVMEKRVHHERGSTRLVVVADAWAGDRIRLATQTFLSHAAGHGKNTLQLTNGQSLPTGAGADLVVFVGHDGLMDFSVESPPRRGQAGRVPSAMVFACDSAAYFLPHFKNSGARPVVLTTGLMAPEGYVVQGAIESWAKGRSPRQMKEAAARAYAHYQKIRLGPARRLFGLSAAKP
jgi:hypothetical protein